MDEKKWVAFIDADEFISPDDYEDGLDKLKPLLDDQGNGAISLNWAVYGSSHSILPANGLVIERFTKRANEQHPVNKHYKSIVRVGDVISTGATPHSFRIKATKNFIMPNGKLQDKIDGISDTVEWSGVRINHYVIKSRSEFFNKKAARGRATTLKESLSRNITFFKNHDLNTIEQSMPLWFLLKVKRKIDEIKDILKQNGFELLEQKTSSHLYRTCNKMGVGVIDALTKDNNALSLKGWAVDGDEKATFNIVAVINNTVLIPASNIFFYDRPDVQRAGIGNGMKSGFYCSIALPDIPVLDIQIYATNKSELVCVELNLDAHLKTIMA